MRRRCRPGSCARTRRKERRWLRSTRRDRSSAACSARSRTSTRTRPASGWSPSTDSSTRRAEPRARYVLLSMLQHARQRNVAIPASLNTPYVNTIAVHDEPYFPGDEALERRYRSWIRWNAAVMVTRAQRPGVGVGGHISSYASVATLTEVGLNHFFRGKDHPGGGDQVYFQGHASPGVYARGLPRGSPVRAPARRVPPGAVAPGRRPAVLPAPAPRAGPVGVPDGVDGPRPVVGDLPGVDQPVPAPARHQGHQPAGRLGVPRRRRDGRARVAAACSSWPASRASTT